MNIRQPNVRQHGNSRSCLASYLEKVTTRGHLKWVIFHATTFSNVPAPLVKSFDPIRCRNQAPGWLNTQRYSASTPMSMRNTNVLLQRNAQQIHDDISSMNWRDYFLAALAGGLT